MMKRYAIIVAGGQGTRMGSETPKQFLELSGFPVLMHTLRAFEGLTDHTILVLPADAISTWNQLCHQYSFSLTHQVTEGGNSRFHSVRNGLAFVPPDCLVAIHDGVRPLVSRQMITDSFDMAASKGNAIAAVALKDSLREQLLTGETRSINRRNYYLVQTPQTFVADSIQQAYLKADHENFTDDAGVVESAGIPIHLYPGDYRNLKITTPEDLLIAAALMQH